MPLPLDGDEDDVLLFVQTFSAPVHAPAQASTQIPVVALSTNPAFCAHGAAGCTCSTLHSSHQHCRPPPVTRGHRGALVPLNRSFALHASTQTSAQSPVTASLYRSVCVNFESRVTLAVSETVSLRWRQMGVDANTLSNQLVEERNECVLRSDECSAATASIERFGRATKSRMLVQCFMLAEILEQVA